MNAPKLRRGDAIGVICPSHIADPAYYRRVAFVIESLGYRPKLGANVEKSTYGYLASERERAQDLNAMVLDQEVRMILFGGGEGSNELLPHIDFDSIRRFPKLFSSYSDGTTLLGAIYARTGLITYYGQGADVLHDLRQYDYLHFCRQFAGEPAADAFAKDSEWITLRGGAATGLLMGGYPRNFALLLGSRYFDYDEGEDYLLFLEDHQRFGGVARVSSYLSHIEQTAFMGRVRGLLFGHYSAPSSADLLARLRRFGETHGIPVAYCDDFGHGSRHGILPIGARARLDADKQSLQWSW